MANTWNKIKSKLKWKKPRSQRGRASRRRNRIHKTYSNSYPAPSANSAASMAPKPRSRKKRSSKSNFFGCLTSTQKELHPQQCNTQPPCPQHADQPSTISTQTQTQQQQEEQQQHEYEGGREHQHKHQRVRPVSPTKSVPSCFTDASSKYVKDNLSVTSDTSKVCKLYHETEEDEADESKHHHRRHREHHRHRHRQGEDGQFAHGQHVNVVAQQQQHHDQQTMAYTPNHSGSNSIIYKSTTTPISYASSSFNATDINEYTVEFTDIYDGVVEVENDKIIEEGDMSEYFSEQADAESTKAEEHDTDICRGTPSIVYCEYEDIDIAAPVRHHQAYAPQPPVGFIFDAPLNQDRESVILQSPNTDVLGLDYNINTGTTKTSTLGTEISDHDDCDHDHEHDDYEHVVPPDDNGIICEQQFIQQLSLHLKQSGVSEQNLDHRWAHHVEMHLEEMRDKKQLELADNSPPYLMNTSNSAQTPITPLVGIPIDGLEDSEDDDLKHMHTDEHSMNNILAKMLQGVHEEQHHHHHHIPAASMNTLSIMPPHHQHSGPVKLDEEAEVEEDEDEKQHDEEEQAPNTQRTLSEHARNERDNSSKSKSSKMSSPSSASNLTTPTSTKTATTGNNSNINNCASQPVVSEEPAYFDGYLFYEKYEIGDKINEGGFGSVYKIRDNNLYSACVKVMHLGNDEPSQIRRRKNCIREFNMTKKALSDEVVEVELYMDNIWTMSDPKAYLVQPYFEGKDLFEFIDDDNYFKKVNAQIILTIFYKIAEKLYDLHYYKRMVHGDLKPENVIILQSHQSDEIEVEIVDYGIAKSIRNLSDDSKFLRSKGHFGTKGYVAPELMRNCKYNRKIDVFSAGVVLYNMATECCLFPKQHKYYKLAEADYYKYLRKKFKSIKKKEQQKIVDILYSCLAYDPDERLDVKQLIQKYFHSRR